MRCTVPSKMPYSVYGKLSNCILVGKPMRTLPELAMGIVALPTMCPQPLKGAFAVVKTALGKVFFGGWALEVVFPTTRHRANRRYFQKRLTFDLLRRAHFL